MDTGVDLDRVVRVTAEALTIQPFEHELGSTVVVVVMPSAFVDVVTFTRASSPLTAMPIVAVASMISESRARSMSRYRRQ